MKLNQNKIDIMNYDLILMYNMGKFKPIILYKVRIIYTTYFSSSHLEMQTTISFSLSIGAFDFWNETQTIHLDTTLTCKSLTNLNRYVGFLESQPKPPIIHRDLLCKNLKSQIAAAAY